MSFFAICNRYAVISTFVDATTFIIAFRGKVMQVVASSCIVASPDLRVVALFVVSSHRRVENGESYIVVSCRVVLCCVVLCCVVLCCVVLCRVVSCCVVLCRVVSCGRIEVASLHRCCCVFASLRRCHLQNKARSDKKYLLYIMEEHFLV